MLLHIPSQFEHPLGTVHATDTALLSVATYLAVLHKTFVTGVLLKESTGRTCGKFQVGWDTQMTKFQLVHIPLKHL
jgi:hypothetical protein